MSAHLLGWIVVVVLGLMDGFILSMLHLPIFVKIVAIFVLAALNVYLSDEAERWWRNRSHEE